MQEPEKRTMSIRLPIEVFNRLLTIQLEQSQQQNRTVSRNEIICSLIESKPNRPKKSAAKRLRSSR